MNSWVKYSFIICMVFISFSLLLLAVIVKADYRAKEVQTQQNKQTDLFEKSIDNFSEFTEQLETGKQGAINSLKKSTPEGLQFITNKSKGEIQAESKKLESIRENDLSGRGREEMSKSGILNEIYLDYSRPLNKQHMKDAKAIASAQDDLLKNLLIKLKEFGVDCKTVKGDKRIEPEYFLQTKITQHKDTIYNQTFCEELRNKYSCTNSLSLRCISPTTDPLTASDFTGTTLPVNFDSTSGILTFGWNKNFTMHGGAGKQYNHKITFKLTNKDGVAEFKLKDVGWDDHLRVTINDHQIFLAPVSHGNKLELIKSRWFYRVKVDDSGNTYNPEYNRWHRRTPNIDLKPYLKNGQNTIGITLIVGGMGGLWLKFKASFKKCNSWQEVWKEKCVLK